MANRHRANVVAVTAKHNALNANGIKTAELALFAQHCARIKADQDPDTPAPLSERERERSPLPPGQQRDGGASDDAFPSGSTGQRAITMTTAKRLRLH